MSKIKQIGYRHLILPIGDKIEHKTAKYTAEIISLTKKGDGMIRVEASTENIKIFGLPANKFPYTFKAKRIALTFRKLYNQLNLEV